MPAANVAVALAAATAWGGGDFCGGMGVKSAGPRPADALRFVIVAHAMSLVVLLGMAVGGGELNILMQPAALTPSTWAVAGGMAGGLGLAAFYMALSRASQGGSMGAAAAISGVLAAAIPAVVSSLREGPPGLLRWAGFAIAALAIWLIAAGAPEALTEATEVSAASRRARRTTLAMATFGGVAFGFYFVALKFASPLGLVLPMALARSGSLVVCAPLLVVLGSRGASTAGEGRGVRSWLRGWQLWLGWAGGVALLDTGGNMLFVAATLLGRLDVAAVLASLYPAATILLAAWRLHERPTQRQWAGMAAGLAAVVMIAT